MKRLLLLALLIAFPAVAGECSVDSGDNQRKEISFKSVFTATCEKSNGKCLENLERLLNGYSTAHSGQKTSTEHPLKKGYQQPYSDTNGGLINPDLKECRVSHEKFETHDIVGAHITLEGKVEADGIAHYTFDERAYGQLSTRMIQKAESDGLNYIAKPTILEVVILGYMKERAADRQVSDLTDWMFATQVGDFATAFKEAIEREWTRDAGQTDTTRANADDERLIKTHLARQIYWPSTWSRGPIRRTAFDHWYEDFHSTKLTLDISVETIKK